VKDRLAKIDANRTNLHIDESSLNKPANKITHSSWSNQAADHLISRDIGKFVWSHLKRNKSTAGVLFKIVLRRIALAIFGVAHYQSRVQLAKPFHEISKVTD
jgi:hypothetical protein